MNLDDLLPAHVAKPQEAQRVWSPQQNAIYEAQAASSENLLIEAVAGSGKTTSIVEAMRRAPGASLFLAFNKAIAEELRSRVYGGDVKTLNALGNGILRRHRPGAALVQWKTHNYLRQNMSPELYELMGKEIVRVISLAKSCAFGIDSPASHDRFLGLVDAYGLNIPPESVQSAAAIARKAFHDLLSPSQAGEFDFDDQLYIPIAEGWTFPRYDNVYVDEAQDLNPIQHLMLKALQSRGARVIAVGDRRQAIYGFRGALTNSMDVLAADFSMSEFPLSTTYRCAQSIVELAQAIVPQIVARSDAPVGTVERAESYPEVISYSARDLVVCRNNFPVFELALQFLKAKIPCRVMSNFLDEMDKFIASFKAHDCKTFLERLEAWYARQKEDCEAHGKWGKLEGITDRFDVCSRFAREFARTSDLLRAVSMLSNATTGPRISTIHKAKGLEAKRVFLLRYDLLPSPKATLPEQIVQEDNLRYVAITRAKDALVILPPEEA